jgi:hypothetical protein
MRSGVISDHVGVDGCIYPGSTCQQVEIPFSLNGQWEASMWSPPVESVPPPRPRNACQHSRPHVFRTSVTCWSRKRLGGFEATHSAWAANTHRPPFVRRHRLQFESELANKHMIDMVMLYRAPPMTARKWVTMARWSGRAAGAGRASGSWCW